MKKILCFLLVAAMATSALAQTDDSLNNPTQGVPVGFQLNFDLDGNFSYISGATNGVYYSDPFTIGGISIGLGAGVRVRKFAFIGAAFNFFGDWGKTTIRNTIDRKTSTKNCELWVVPIYLDTRWYLPTKGRTFPFWEIGIGGYVGLSGKVTTDLSAWGEGVETVTAVPKGGFYFTTGLGVELKRLVLGIGYKYFDNSTFRDHYGYVKLGISIGRNAKIK